MELYFDSRVMEQLVKSIIQYSLLKVFIILNYLT